MREKLRVEQGFTLIEVIVAIVIITGLVATFAPLIVSSVERSTQTLYAIRGSMEKDMALGRGESTKVIVSGPNVEGSSGDWEVYGTLVFVHEIDEDEKIDAFLVSFVIPTE